MNNKLYDVLKWIGRVALPAIGTLYAALGMVWGFPFSKEVVATLTAVTLFLNTVLGVSSAQYNKAVEARPAEEINEDIVDHEIPGEG